MTAPTIPPAAGGRRLAWLLEGHAAVPASSDTLVGGLATDSRRVTPGDLFLACSGIRTSGAAFIDDAVAAGAAAVVCDADDPAASYGTRSGPDGEIAVIPVAGLAERLGAIAGRFHGDPSREMTVIGITGTNGKTSCTHFLAQALIAGGDRCGVIGTLGYGEPDVLRPGSHTTPDPLTLQSELAALYKAGVANVAIEVSSHALEQHRIGGVSISGAVFTNLGHDHLDYHADRAAYGLAKKKLFMLPELGFAVINRDDPFGREILAGLPAGVTAIAWGIGAREDSPGQFQVTAVAVRQSAAGLALDIESSWGGGVLQAPLLGAFNARNLLAVLSCLLMLGVPLDEALVRLSSVRPVPGRMERLGGESGLPLVIVDYAHTPDALEAALEALRPHCSGRLRCVFGCGGNRDQAKRPLMGAAAGRLADDVVVTSDNPRDEDPVAIISGILAGINDHAAVEVIPERGAAIRRAITAAAAGDIVLIAGKGHEDYQIIGDRRLPFSDREQAGAVLGELRR